MSNKTGYKMTKIGEIPEDWDLNQLDRLALPQKGAIKIGPFGSQLKKCDLSTEGIKVYGQENVMSNDFTLGSRYVSADKFRTLKSVEVFPGDVLVTMMGSLGFAAVIPEGAPKGIMDSHLLRIRVNRNLVLPKFIALLLRDSDIIKRQIRKLSQGAIMSGLNSKLVRSFIVPVPHLEEQYKITSIFSTVDDAIQKIDEIIRRTQELKKGLMQQLLTKGIGHTKFKQTELGEIPEEWKVAKVGEICKSIVPGRNKPKKFDGNIPWITLPDIEEIYITSSKSGLKVSREEVKKCGGKIVPPNSVIMSCIGEFGIVAITTRDLVINQQLHAFICPENVEPYFLAMALMSQAKYMHSIATITVVPYLNKDNCNSIPIPIPNISEQKKIASIFSAMDEKIETEKQRKEQLEKLKKGLMQDLLTGRVRVKVD